MADGFLGRWSRRKQDVREGKPLEEPPAPAPLTSSPAAAAVAPVAHPRDAVPAAGPSAGAGAATSRADGVVAAPPPPPSLEDAQVLTPQSDFKPFVAHDVAPEVRNLAMKKLFADPHFNVMDGLDIYIGDYSQPDPMPDGMLRKMVSAHTLGFFDHEKKQDAAVVQTPASPVAVADAPEDSADGPRDDAGAQTAPAVAQSSLIHAESGVLNSQPDPASASAPDALALPASPTQHDDQDAHLRLQPDDAPERQGVGRGTA
ncbi:DUF3306 domain-containing protein [Acidovorax sp. RAC01]|uniref:DUF3306 domain-containing protein n=1 Tax=Acidovorax sp. RAC01 TaxID=1842533 RepID=UPI00083E6FE9|nr:DUF3306 domain-containing protein [Acidovorax sp. RAC01]AOG24229.1 hypothetical protein BSY15_2421 [Acidovorax sp. RAC01]